MMMMVTGNTGGASRQQALPQAPFTCAWSSARRWFTPGATRRTLALVAEANMIEQKATHSNDLPTIYRNETPATTTFLTSSTPLLLDSGY